MHNVCKNCASPPPLHATPMMTFFIIWFYSVSCVLPAFSREGGIIFSRKPLFAKKFLDGICSIFSLNKCNKFSNKKKQNKTTKSSPHQVDPPSLVGEGCGMRPGCQAPFPHSPQPPLPSPFSLQFPKVHGFFKVTKRRLRITLSVLCFILVKNPPL